MSSAGEAGLLEGGRLKRGARLVRRVGVYTVGAGQVRHKIEIASVYLRMRRELREGESVEMALEYPLCGEDRADALITWRVPPAEHRGFLEVQRTGYAKLAKYARYLIGGDWRRQWAEFPRIMVIGLYRASPQLALVEIRDSIRDAIVTEEDEHG